MPKKMYVDKAVARASLCRQGIAETTRRRRKFVTTPALQEFVDLLTKRAYSFQVELNADPGDNSAFER